MLNISHFDGNTLTATTQRIKGTDSKSKICTLNCTLKEIAVLCCIETNQRMTQKEMAKAIGKSERTVKTINSALVDKGILIRKNSR